MNTTKVELLKLSTFNCRGLGQNSKRRTIFHWIKRYHSGIIFLQETHSTVATENAWKNDWNGQIYFCHGNSTARGVAILISPEVNIKINEIGRDLTGRYLLLDTNFEGQPLILVNIYAPTKDNQQLQSNFLDFIRDCIEEHSDKHLFIGGDFNICIEPSIDKKGGISENISKNSEKLTTLMDQYNLIDIWRFLNPESQRFTRREMCKGGLVQSRLDYWLVSNHILYDLQGQDISPGLRSDHSLVYILLRIKNTQQKGRGFFKFNCNLLKDKEYVEEIKNVIQNFKKENTSNPNLGLLWDTLKCEIRGRTMSYASAAKKKKLNMKKI